MPYIDQADRALLDSVLAPVLAVRVEPGDLNYVITRLIGMYWQRNPHYAGIAEITGVLENAKQEFYRRIASIYEDKKIKTNGDVYNA